MTEDLVPVNKDVTCPYPDCRTRFVVAEEPGKKKCPRCGKEFDEYAN